MQKQALRSHRLFDTSEYPEIITFMKKKKKKKVLKYSTVIQVLADHLYIFFFITILRVENGVNKLHIFAIYVLILLKLLED